MFLAQSTTVDAISNTVTKAIDSGTVGIAVLLAVGLLVLGGLMGLLIWKVIIPLLKQAIEMTAQVGALISRTHTAIEHSNETNTLQTQATNFQTGEIQTMNKNIVVLGEQFTMLGKNFSAFGILQSDTTAALVQRFDTFDAQLAKIDGLKQLIETSHGDHKDIKDLLLQMVESMHVIQSDIRLLVPPVSTNTINVNTGTPKPADTATDSEAAA